MQEKKQTVAEISKASEILGTIPTTTKMAECEIHGEYMTENKTILGMVFSIGCPKCIEEKDKISAEEEKERFRKAENERVVREEQKLEKIGIRRRFYQTSFDTYETFSEEMKNALEICRDYAKRKEEILKSGECVFLIGRPGTGKNHLAISILKEFGGDVFIIKASEMIRKIRESYKSGSEEREQSLIERFACYDLLIVNEVGVQFGTDNEKNLLFEVLDIRYENMLPTIFISNLNIQNIKEFVGGRVIDRMLENGKIIEFTWGSYRGEDKKS